MAGGDARLSGTWVSGRDINLHPVLRPELPWTGVFQLPPDIDDFTGRDLALQTVRGVLERSGADQATAVIVSAIAGKAGVGKTALATRVAHQLRDRFPDGQLYVNLRGAEAQRLDPTDVLGEFLLDMGVGRAAIPDRLDQRAARYRAQLDGRRVLVVLDNAAEEAQVRPLLPGSPGSAALITSRAPLAGLAGVHSVRLDVLEPDQAIELLAKVIGRRRVDAEPEAARRIAELCGRLPLAVRIAAAKLLAREHWTLAVLAARLTDEHTRLAELRIRDLEVRASFTLTYQDLDDDERRTFRLLGLIKAPDFPAWVAAALLDAEPAEAEELVERLVEAQVLEVAQQTGSELIRFRFHDLLRLFARERLSGEESVAAQKVALQRVLDAHLALAKHAAGLLEPGEAGGGDPAGWLAIRVAGVAERIAVDPAAWFTAERANLVAAVEQAHDGGIDEVTWELARSLAYFFLLRSHWTDWQHTQELALRSAQRAENHQAVANALRSLGVVTTQRGKLDEAIAQFQRALTTFDRLADRRGQAWTLVGLGNAYLEQWRLDQAIAQFQQAVTMFRQLADRRGEAWALVGFGVAHRVQWRFDEAFERFQDAVALFGPLADRRGQAHCLLNLGIVHRDKGQVEAALRWFDQALPIFRALGDQYGETFALLNVGHLHREQGRLREADSVLETCLTSFRLLGDHGGEAWTLLNLGMVRLAEGRSDEALATFNGCRAMFESQGGRRGEAWTDLGTGEVHRECGRNDDAVAFLDRSLAILRELGDRLGQAKALSSYGLVLAAVGDREAATSRWLEALAIFRALGAPEASNVEGWLSQ